MVSQVRDRVATTDAQGRRIKLFPSEVPKNGFWKRLRFKLQWALIAIYLIVPWLTLNGHPVLQIDLEHRRFSVLGVLFFAHEMPNLVFVVLTGLLFIALMTAIFGRIWCGWSCPQTVFLEQVFRPIERFLIGDHFAQRALSQAPWSVRKVSLQTAKWLCFTMVALILSHSFLGYFVGGPSSFQYLTTSPSLHPVAFFWVWLLVLVVLFDFGWFREQFCLIACPYGRFQSVMMDEHSLFLAYDEKRKDCIECNKCVTVCPTGIDVRNGLQFECIACTACADACDSVMLKIGKPTKLIGYGSMKSLQGMAPKVFRGRTWVYATLMCISLGFLIVRLSQRVELQSEVQRAVGKPYELVELNGETFVLNQFKIRYYNLDWSVHQAGVALSARVGSRAELIQGAYQTNQIESGKSEEQQFFIKIPLSEFHAMEVKSLAVETYWQGRTTQQINEVVLMGPDVK